MHLNQNLELAIETVREIIHALALIVIFLIEAAENTVYLGRACRAFVEGFKKSWKSWNTEFQTCADTEIMVVTATSNASTTQPIRALPASELRKMVKALGHTTRHESGRVLNKPECLAILQTV